jgi:16S rRNA (cytosine967-C5)-methyltransferase
MEVVYGVARWKRALEWFVEQLATNKPDANVLPYLLTGLYQIMFMENVVDYAAVNETIEAVKQSSAPYAAGFVNGVLRNVLRKKAALKAALDTQPIGIRASHPDVLIERWVRRFGEEKTLALCKWNNSRPSVIIHPNMRLISMQDFTESLKKKGIETEPHRAAPETCLILTHGTHVTDLPGYAEGLFSIQDPSTFTAVALLDPQPGELVLDACAAPGGKAVLIAEKMNDSGRLIAMDLHDDRLKRLAGNVGRMRLISIEITQGDATREQDIKRVLEESSLDASPQVAKDKSGSAGPAFVRRLRRGTRLALPNPPTFNKVGRTVPVSRKPMTKAMFFDRILLDVPCSNTGVLSRRSDARWRFSTTRMSQLVAVQRTMLDTTARFLKHGGTLVYSTCSLEPEECSKMVEAWLAANRNFRLAKTIELFPPETHTDGIFAAALIKQ